MSVLTDEVDMSNRRLALPNKEGIALAVLFAILVILALASLAIGAVDISIAQTISILLSKIGINNFAEFSSQQESVVTAIRVPRLLMGLATGAGLAIAGVVLQSLFRNPLADPALIGVSSGSALFVAIAIVLGETIFGAYFLVGRAYALPVAAFIGGLLSTSFIYQIGRRDGSASMATMLLAGIAVNAFAGAGIGMMSFYASDAQLRNITFWTLGSLSGATWQTVTVAVPLIVVAALLILRLARPLNVLLLGETEAKYLGVNIEKIKWQAIVLVVFTVGSAVAVTGTIGFVGLVVPHLLRLTIGADHRFLLPGSALLGGCLLIGADIVSRTIVSPAEIPIGIITALIGAPFFIWLLLKRG